MTLALTIDWSSEFVAVTIVDAAARSIVAEGRSPHGVDAPAHDSPENWWSSLGDATRTALDGLAVLNLTTEDIDSIELSGDLADTTGGSGSLSFLSALLEPAPSVLTGDPIGMSALSSSAASVLGLPPGCPITLSPSFERSLRWGDQVL